MSPETVTVGPSAAKPLPAMAAQARAKEMLVMRFMGIPLLDACVS